MDVNNLSDMKFKVMDIRMLSELSMNYNNIKQEIGTINKIQSEVKNNISDIKNKPEGIKSRLNEQNIE